MPYLQKFFTTQTMQCIINKHRVNGANKPYGHISIIWFITKTDKHWWHRALFFFLQIYMTSMVSASMEIRHTSESRNKKGLKQIRWK